VSAEREILPYDSRWTDYLKDIPGYSEEAAEAAVALADRSGASRRFRPLVCRQRLTASASRATRRSRLRCRSATSPLPSSALVADVSRKYMKETVRSTVEQNLVLRWVSESDLPALYTDLKSVDLATPIAGTIVDVSSCPGTDTCKLGIASSRGLAGELRIGSPPRTPNSTKPSAACASRSAAASIPAASTTWPISASTASAATRTAIRSRTSRFCWAANGPTTPALRACHRRRAVEANSRNGGPHHRPLPPERLEGETFQAFIKRIGKAECKKMIEEFTAVPPHDDRTLVLQRLGRSARILHRRYRRGRMRR
jgi:sulfite reductase (ferredoxin)